MYELFSWAPRGEGARSHKVPLWGVPNNQHHHMEPDRHPIYFSGWLSNGWWLPNLYKWEMEFTVNHFHPFSKKIKQNRVGSFPLPRQQKDGSTPSHGHKSAVSQLMVHCWFGARWFGILRVPLSNCFPFIRESNQNPNHRVPNHQLTISWVRCFFSEKRGEMIPWLGEVNRPSQVVRKSFNDMTWTISLTCRKIGWNGKFPWS